MRRRYSLLAILFLLTLEGFGGYGLALPSINAHRFAAAIEGEDFAAADRMFINPNHQFLATLYADSWTWRARVSLAPWSFEQFLSGQRSLSMELAYGKPGRLNIREWNLLAASNGID